MKIRRFNESTKSINENVTLYRLVSVPKGEPLVVNTENPGKFYFKSKGDIDTSVMKGKLGDLHVIKVNTTSNNIDTDKSEIESELHKCKCVVLKDDSKADIDNIEPYKK